VEIKSINNFPTQAGLASSASGTCGLGLSFARITNYFEETETELQ